MNMRSIFVGTTCACLTCACQTFSAPATSQLTAVYQPAGRHTVVQVRHYPSGKQSDADSASVTNLGKTAAGRTPTYSETFSIPAGRDFYFGFNLVANNRSALPELLTSTCNVNMRLRPEEGQHFEVVFATARDRCTTQVFRLVRAGNGATQKVPDVSAVKIE